ncbi:MAG: 3-hydroxyacyl-CoA dehydrogenase NAD-binding domain-containing protein [Planctomycetota bacterium]
MQFETVGVVGCGLMGHGIAQVAAAAGQKRVVVVESDAAALERGVQRIEQSLGKLAQKAVEKGAMDPDSARTHVADSMARITPSLARKDLAACDLVVEAIVEDLQAKCALWRDLHAVCPPRTVFASNTSSFPIAAMAGSSGRPERTIGLHFFNPVQLMGLVEVVRTPDTAPEVHAAALAFARACGKEPVTCADTPGFIVNRLLVPYLVQALLMFERGDASKEDIDTAMRLGCGHPMGPITLADYVGLDTTLSILEGWCQRHPQEPAFVVPASLRAKVQDGKLGRKTGEGFYRWEGDKRQ